MKNVKIAKYYGKVEIGSKQYFLFSYNVYNPLTDESPKKPGFC